MLLREIRVRMPLPIVKISISDAYLSDAQTMADFFNRIGRLLPVAKGCIDLRYGRSTPMCFLGTSANVASRLGE